MGILCCALNPSGINAEAQLAFPHLELTLPSFQLVRHVSSVELFPPSQPDGWHYSHDPHRSLPPVLSLDFLFAHAQHTLSPKLITITTDSYTRLALLLRRFTPLTHTRALPPPPRLTPVAVSAVRSSTSPPLLSHTHTLSVPYHHHHRRLYLTIFLQQCVHGHRPRRQRAMSSWQRSTRPYARSRLFRGGGWQSCSKNARLSDRLWLTRPRRWLPVDLVGQHDANHAIPSRNSGKSRSVAWAERKRKLGRGQSKCDKRRSKGNKGKCGKRRHSKRCG